jgi:hypothetical protein
MPRSRRSSISGSSDTRVPNRCARIAMRVRGPARRAPGFGSRRERRRIDVDRDDDQAVLLDDRAMSGIVKADMSTSLPRGRASCSR